MNTKKPLRTVVRSKEPKLLGVSFNQDQSCFAICSENGFKVFSTYPMQLRMNRVSSESNQQETISGIGIIKMLYKTNYVALVGGGRRPRFPLNKLCIWDDMKEKNSIILEFSTPILNVHLSRTHIIVVLKNSVLIYSFRSVPQLLFLFETIDNMHGISDLAVSERSSILVFPARLPGQLHIVDVNSSRHPDENQNNKKSVALIKAHRNPIQCVCLSPLGHMVASASELGTLIRVHNTKTCSLIYEFRRGVDTAVITDMKFSPDGNKLAVLSDKSTLHIYHIYGNDGIEENKTHVLKKFPLFTNYFGSTWSFVSKNVGDKNDTINDTGIIGWPDDYSVVIVWKLRGIWEKYDIIRNPDVDGNLKKGEHKWIIRREGWRSVCD